MVVESSVLGGGLLKFRLEEDVVIRHMSRLYKDAASVVRELLANEEAACIATASHKPGFDYTRDCCVEVEYYPAMRRLVIRGVNSLGIDVETLKNVLGYYGRSLNANIANVSGQFGMGFKGFVQLTTNEKGGEEGSMILRTHARRTGERYAVRCTPMGFQPIEEPGLESMDYYGTEVEVVHKEGVEPGELVEAIRENSYLSPVPIYLLVVDDRANARREEEFKKIPWEKRDEYVESLGHEKTMISQHTLRELLEERLRDYTPSERYRALPRVQVSTPDYEAVALLEKQNRDKRTGEYSHSGRVECHLVGRAIGGDAWAPLHFSHVFVNFKSEDTVSPTPSRDELDGDQLKAFIENELTQALREGAIEHFPRVRSVADYLALNGEQKSAYDELYNVFRDFGVLGEDEKTTRGILYHRCEAYSGGDVWIKDVASIPERVYYTDRFYRDQCEKQMRDGDGGVVVKARSLEEAGMFKALGFLELPRVRSKTNMAVSVHKFIEGGASTHAKDEPSKQSLDWLEPGEQYVMITPCSKLQASDVVELGLLSPNEIRVLKANKAQEKHVRELLAQGDYTRKPVEGKASVRSLEEYVEDALEEEVFTSRGSVKLGSLIAGRDGITVYSLEGAGEQEFYPARMAHYWNATKQKGVLVPAVGSELFKILVALKHMGRKHAVVESIAEPKSTRRYYGDRLYHGKEADARAYAKKTLSTASNEIIERLDSLADIEKTIEALERMDPVHMILSQNNSPEGLEKVWTTPAATAVARMEEADLFFLVKSTKPQKYRNAIAKMLLEKKPITGFDAKELEFLRAYTTGEVRGMVEAEVATRELRGQTAD